MTARAPVLREHGNAYNIFILVLTLFSFVLMGLLLLPLDDDTRILVTVYDNAICVIFLADFFWSLSGSRPRRAYFIHARGWLDLLGSIPSLGFFQFTALLRLARISRLARIGRLLGGQNRKAIVADVLANRGSYATFITILAAGIVLSVASILIVQFESKAPDANIKTGWDALWWGVVTLTTVGYGDKYPVTVLGQFTAASVMFAGVGIIGALASILASILVPPSKPEAPAPVAATADEAAVADVVAQVVAALRVEAAGQAVAGPGVVAGAVAASGAVEPGAAGAATGGLAPEVIADELAQLRAEIAALRAALPPGSG